MLILMAVLVLMTSTLHKTAMVVIVGRLLISRMMVLRTVVMINQMRVRFMVLIIMSRLEGRVKSMMAMMAMLVLMTST